MSENKEKGKLLLLKIEGDYPAEVDVAVYDFPMMNDADKATFDCASAAASSESAETVCGATTFGEPRRRFRFSVNCGEFDVKRLIREGMDINAAMEHYREWIYDTVRMYILSDWYTPDDCAELLAAVRKHVEKYYGQYAVGTERFF